MIQRLFIAASLLLAVISLTNTSAYKLTTSENSDGLEANFGTYWDDTNDYEGWAKRGRELGGRISIVKNSNRLVREFADANRLEHMFEASMKKKTSHIEKEQDEKDKEEQAQKNKKKQEEDEKVAKAKAAATAAQQAVEKEREDSEKKLKEATTKADEKKKAEQNQKNEETDKKNSEQKTKEQNSKENANKQKEKEETQKRLRCKKPIKDPSVKVGQFLTPVFNFRNTFQGDSSFDSPATIVGDFNGDGASDFARLQPTLISFFISKKDGTYYQPIYRFSPGWDFTVNENIWTSLKATDLNGDKKSDIIRTAGTYNHAFISKGENDCFFRDGDMPSYCFTVTAFQYPWGWNFVGGWRWAGRATVQGDFNNDGRGDYARIGATYIHFFISQGNGQFYFPILPLPQLWNFNWDATDWTVRTGDFDGNCQTDLLINSATSSRLLSLVGDDIQCWSKPGWINAGSCSSPTTYNFASDLNFVGSWTWDSRAFITGDFNGDGRHDFARLGGVKIYFFISRGNGQFYNPVYNFPGGWNFGHDEEVWTTLPVGDFDGDGKADFIRSYGTYHHGFYSRGNDARCWNVNSDIPADCLLITTYRYPNGWNFVGGWKWNSLATQVGDFNGDGLDDFINLRGSTYTHQFYSQ